MTTDLNPLRRRILEVAYRGAAGHVPSAFSILDIVWTLYDQVMTEHDQFVLSKGHGCLAHYAVLEAKGILPKGEMDLFGRPGSRLGGHPDRLKVPGVLASTGSLGHGLPIACGLALAKRLDNFPGRVFCLVGDGELQEGSMWEALRFVGALDLANLCLVIDANETHRFTDAVDPRRQTHRILTDLGFHVRRCDGHKHYSLEPACEAYSAYPVAVIAETVKGKGVRRMQDNPGGWHRRTPTEEEFGQMMEELSR